ncbi:MULTISPECIES: hypothetical protein [Alteromonas]|nr:MULTISPECIES: hypothetical protein [Alteromonas]
MVEAKQSGASLNTNERVEPFLLPKEEKDLKTERGIQTKVSVLPLKIAK